MHVADNVMLNLVGNLHTNYFFIFKGCTYSFFFSCICSKEMEEMKVVQTLEDEKARKQQRVEELYV